MEDLQDLDTYNSNKPINHQQGGAKTNGLSLHNGFIDYITTISSHEKSQMMNLIQYGGLAVLPLLILLKIMKMYVPQEDPLKGSPELVIEVLGQLAFILIAFFFIHKLVLYVPTYSKVAYEHMNLLHVILPLFFLLFALDTGIGVKVNILFDRLLIFLGIKKENYENKQKKGDKNSVNGPQQQQQSSTNTMNQYDFGSSGGMQQENMASRLVGGFPTQRDAMLPGGGSQPQMPQQREQFEMMMPTEPMAANEVMGGSLF